MEEQRIGMMYLNLFQKWALGLWDNVFPRGLRRSPALPFVLVLIVVGLPIVAWRLHRQARFAAVRKEIQGESKQPVSNEPRPGGLDPIVLTRSQSPGSNMPEFRSATFLPGLGMEFLHLSASIPGKGEVELLDAPSVKDLADGTTPTRVGPNDRWGALEVPWAGQLTGILTPVGSEVRTSWLNKQIEAPIDVPGRAISEGDMLATLSADAQDASPLGPAQRATGSFNAVTFDQRWPGKTTVTVSAVMNAQAIDLTITAKNVGDQAEPMGIGWHPRFLLASGDRDGAEIRLPLGDQLEIADHLKQTPSGRFGPPGPSLTRFQSHAGALGVESADETVVHMRPGLLEHGSAVEVRDLSAQYGLRMTAISSSIREMRVTSAANSKWVALGAQTNYDDPFGKEWGAADQAIDTLQPGQTLEWKIRLEIFPISGHPVQER